MVSRTKKLKAKKQAKKQRRINPVEDRKKPFAEHLLELRRRFFYVAAAVVTFSGIAYAFEHQLINALLKPAKGQQFIYTSPGGGVDFLFRVCIYVGLALSIPLIVYQCLKYLEPLLGSKASKLTAMGSIASGVLALAGMAFGYFVGLPNALHFLLHQFVTQQIKPLVTIQSYMSFVTVYMLGSALLFQAPLILIFINRIKPLKPQKLLKNERWVILVAFICAGLMNPSPNIFAQLLVVVPLLITYQIGIGVIWYANRKGKRPAFVQKLLAQDAKVQADRLERYAMMQKMPQDQPNPTPESPPQTSTLAVAPAPLPAEKPVASLPARPVQRRYIILDIRPGARGNELA